MGNLPFNSVTDIRHVSYIQFYDVLVWSKVDTDILYRTYGADPTYH